MRKKRRRTWTSLTAAAVLLPAVTPLGHTAAPDRPHENAGAGTAIPLRSPMMLAEGGEGGEAGIDTRLASEDPIVFVTALDVIAAHYHAGLAAYLAGAHQEAGEMFAHPLSEVYLDLGETIAKLGVADFGPQMSKASEIALAGAPDAEVTAAASAVFDALAQAEGKAPRSSVSAIDVDKAVLADMLNRAAMQYASALKTEANEPYLDGYGFFVAARERAWRIDAELSASPAAHKATTEALALLAKVYPSPKRPSELPIAAGEALAAVSKALLELSAR